MTLSALVTRDGQPMVETALCGEHHSDEGLRAWARLRASGSADWDEGDFRDVPAPAVIACVVCDQGAAQS